jgi:phosphatidylserine synthase
MAKLSKCKNVMKDYTTSILTGSAVILGLIAIAVSLQHFLTLMSIAMLVGVLIYFIWRIN